MPLTHGEESPDFQHIHISWIINKVLKSHMTPGDNGIGYSNKRQISRSQLVPTDFPHTVGCVQNLFHFYFKIEKLTVLVEKITHRLGLYYLCEYS